MVSREAVDEFVAQRKLALVGVSRRRGKFGNAALTELAAKGFEVFPVHPSADAVEGKRCWRSLAELPEKVGGVLISVPPGETEKVVRDVVAAGIPRVWMQKGAESAEAIRFCEEHGVRVVHGECILMFAEPAAFSHRAHRWFRGVFGTLPGGAATA